MLNTLLSSLLVPLLCLLGLVLPATALDTSAGVGLEIIDLIGTFLVVVATRVIPIVLVIVVAAEAVHFRSTAKLRRR